MLKGSDSPLIISMVIPPCFRLPIIPHSLVWYFSPLKSGYFGFGVDNMGCHFPIHEVCVSRGVVSCVLQVGQREHHAVGNLGHLSDHLETLRKPLRGTNNFMTQRYRRHGEWSFSPRDLWKDRKFASECK